ncbi:MAG TPA: succinyl-diaminopimelate desuccinylase [Rhizomicrobium sp.]|nr:succinyl-diaminopimelate desuccinylase [Rhizomicrobium sp.]
MAAIDPVAFAQALIRCPSVTPADAGALDIVERALSGLGFVCRRLKFEEVDNLYARIGSGAPNFCYAGHTDVVPPGDVALWRYGPFEAEIRDEVLYGRGAADMKSSIAAFVNAVSRYLPDRLLNGSISLLITGDEEGPSVNGTAKVLDWMKQKGETISHCIVGEPTATARAGDTLKIGRRGSLTAYVTARGSQGHVGYPHKAKNPIPAMASLVTKLSSHVLDKGTEHFEPSTLSFTTVDVGNPATNVIPAEARATLNIRFNDAHTGDSLRNWIESEAEAVAKQTGCEIDLRFVIGGEVFLTKPGSFTALVAEAVKDATGAAPEFSTTGGTSDARFIRNHCPVAELGLAGGTMHKSDECMPLAEIHRLSEVYLAILERYFVAPPT